MYLRSFFLALAQFVLIVSSTNTGFVKMTKYFKHE